MTRWLAYGSLVLLLAACSDDSSGGGTADTEDTAADTPTGDAEADTPADGGGDVEEDAGGDLAEEPDVAGEVDLADLADVAEDVDADAGVDPQVARGEYLVLHVADCVFCHTPLDNGVPMVETHLLAGNPAFVDFDPENADEGLLPTPNLTPHENGLLNWTDEEIKDAFLNGVRPGDEPPIHPFMPYFAFHNMSNEDADAIVAYLRSIPANDQVIPASQVIAPMAASPIPIENIPVTTLAEDDPNYDRAVRGRYLAAEIGICLECHSPETMDAVPRDLDLLMAGGRAFPAAALGLPAPPFPDLIYTRNITPDATGIQGWTAEMVRVAIKQGLDDDGDGICPPMPFGPMGAFGGMTDEDALDIGWYVTTIPAVENVIPADCTPPPPG